MYLCSGSWQPRLSAGVVTSLTAPHSSAPGTALHPATLHIHQHSTHRTLALAASTIYFPVANTVSPPMKPVSPSLSSGNPVRGPAVSRCGWPGAGLHQAATHLSMETQPSLALCSVYSVYCVLGTRGTVPLSTLPQPSSIICLAPPPTSPEPRLLPATGPVLIHLCDVPHNADTMLYTGCCRSSGNLYRSINQRFF